MLIDGISTSRVFKSALAAGCGAVALYMFYLKYKKKPIVESNSSSDSTVYPKSDLSHTEDELSTDLISYNQETDKGAPLLRQIALPTVATTSVAKENRALPPDSQEKVNETTDSCLEDEQNWELSSGSGTNGADSQLMREDTLDDVSSSFSSDENVPAT